MSNPAYKNLLLNVIGASNTKVSPGRVVIAIWEDNQHLEQWISRKNESNNLKMISAPLKLLPQLEVADINNDAVIALGIGKEEDYSDVRIVYYLTVKPKD